MSITVWNGHSVGQQGQVFIHTFLSVISRSWVPINQGQISQEGHSRMPLATALAVAAAQEHAGTDKGLGEDMLGTTKLGHLC